MLVFLLITFVLVNTPPTFSVDSRIQPYVDEIVELSKDNLDGNIPILVKKLKNNDLGYCYYAGIRYIEIDLNKFLEYNFKERLAIVAHELMHCEKSCDHNNKLLKDGCHSSLMHSQMQRSGCYEKHWDRYVKEMQEIDC